MATQTTTMQHRDFRQSRCPGRDSVNDGVPFVFTQISRLTVRNIAALKVSHRSTTSNWQCEKRAPMPRSIGDLRAVRRGGRLTSLGFTLTELLVTIAVLTALATIAAPSYSSLILNNRISAQVNDMVAAVNLARSEAVTRGNAVTICRSSDGASCAASGTNWAVGWIVFNDPNANATVDAGEQLIRAYPSMSGTTTALSVGAGMQQSLTFLGVGRPLGSFTGGEIQVCPAEGGSYCRSLCLNSQGRPKVDTPTQRATDATCGN